MKKTICLDVFSNLPVPTTKGGAVQTLYEILMQENEKYGKVRLVCVRIYD